MKGNIFSTYSKHGPRKRPTNTCRSTSFSEKKSEHCAIDAFINNSLPKVRVFLSLNQQFVSIFSTKIFGTLQTIKISNTICRRKNFSSHKKIIITKREQRAIESLIINYLGKVRVFHLSNEQFVSNKTNFIDKDLRTAPD